MDRAGQKGRQGCWIRGFWGVGYGWGAVTSDDPYPPSFTARSTRPPDPYPPTSPSDVTLHHSRYVTSQPCSPVLSRACPPCSLVPPSRAAYFPPARAVALWHCTAAPMPSHVCTRRLHMPLMAAQRRTAKAARALVAVGGAAAGAVAVTRGPAGSSAAAGSAAAAACTLSSASYTPSGAGSSRGSAASAGASTVGDL